MSTEPSAKSLPPAQAELTLHPDQPGPTLRPTLQGHFAEHLGRCIDEGIWVGEDSPIPNTRGIRRDVVSALRRLRVPVLRWPGGCFADEYHWKHGIGPRSERPKSINTHWGGVIENHHFGTHEFMDLCEQIGAEPYVCGNLGSGTVEEMMQWVEYMTSDDDSYWANLRRRHGRERPWKLTYFGIGNESWGCGGHMRPEYYADNFRRYATFVKHHGGQKVQRVACGPNGDDFGWTEVLMNLARPQMDGLSLHWYTLPTGNWQAKGSATDFGEDQWHATFVQTLRMEELIRRHAAIMDRFDPERRVGLVVDEWGTWYEVEPGTNPGFLYQQNTLRDALVAAVNLQLFQRHADRVRMANIAQTVNVLQAMILTDQEKMLLTPSYHVFDMYAVHQAATLVPTDLETPAYVLDGASVPMLDAAASRDQEGRIHLSLVNLHPYRAATLRARPLSGELTGQKLTASTMQAHNTFDHPRAVEPTPLTDFAREGDGVAVTVPPKSVVMLEIRAPGVSDG
jgi:alpha-N-arabinofuranosidase